MPTSNEKNYKLHVKTGDRVIVVSGKDKGKIANIKKSLPKEKKLIVEGINIIKKAVKPNPARGIQGGFAQYEAPINSSKVMLYCQKCEKPTRIRHEVSGDNKVRVCKKCGEQLD